MRLTLLRILIISFCLVAQGCTYQAWYTGFLEHQRQECYKNSPNTSEAQRCIEQVNSTTYDQYKAQREQAIERSGQ